MNELIYRGFLDRTEKRFWLNRPTNLYLDILNTGFKSQSLQVNEGFNWIDRKYFVNLGIVGLF